MKKVEILSAKINTVDEADFFNLEAILLNPDFQDVPISLYNKHVQLSFVEDKGDYILGIIETTQMGPTPPKFDVNLKTKNSLGLANTEGLLFGNVFLFVKEFQVLFYEVTKNGTFIGQIPDFFYKLTKESEVPKFDLRFYPLMNIHAMEKLLKMGNKKSIHMQFANPDGLIKKIKNDSNSVKETAKIGKELDADVIEVTYKTFGRKDNFLNTKKVDKLIEFVNSQYQLLRDHFEYIKVKGYDDDTEKVTEIDMIKDKMLEFIKYPEAKNSKDISPKERKEQISLAYERRKIDLSKYFKNDDM